MNFLFLLLLMNREVIPLSSSAFQNMGDIPSQYTCEGKSINPPLTIGAVPADTKSLVLIIDDPDADKGVFDHWVVYNIPPAIKAIAENSKPGTQGKNGKGESAYTGPCPPTGKHHYYIKVYAIDRMLDLKGGASKKDVQSAIDGHILGEGELVGMYEKGK